MGVRVDFLSVFMLLCSWPICPSYAKRKDVEESRSERMLCFTVIGDIGGVPEPPFTTWMQRKVADEMEKVRQAFKPAFCISQGS